MSNNDYIPIQKDELRDLHRDRNWADFFCVMFLKEDHYGRIELSAKQLYELTRYARIRNIEIPHHEN